MLPCILKKTTLLTYTKKIVSFYTTLLTQGVREQWKCSVWRLWFFLHLALNHQVKLLSFSEMKKKWGEKNNHWSYSVHSVKIVPLMFLLIKLLPVTDTSSSQVLLFRLTHWDIVHTSYGIDDGLHRRTILTTPVPIICELHISKHTICCNNKQTGAIKSFSSPQEEAHPEQRGHARWISTPSGKGRWPQPLCRAHLGTSRPGPTAGHLPGICSQCVFGWHSERSEAIWTAAAHGSLPVREVIWEGWVY